MADPDDPKVDSGLVQRGFDALFEAMRGCTLDGSGIAELLVRERR